MNNLVFCTNSRYAEYLTVLIYSILINTKIPLKFYILYSSLDERYKRDLISAISLFKDINGCSYQYEFIQVDIPGILSKFKYELIQLYDSYDTYTRLFIPVILKDYKIDKFIYMDIDMLCKKDIKPLFEILNNINTFGGVIDKVTIERGDYYITPKYVNAGLLLCDNAYFSRIDFTRSCIDFVNNCEFDKLRGKDQDIINNVIPDEDKVLLDIKFNEYLPQRSLVKEAVILHYTGAHKPWMSAARWRLKKVYWQAYKVSLGMALRSGRASPALLKLLIQVMAPLRAVFNAKITLRNLIFGKQR